MSVPTSRLKLWKTSAPPFRRAFSTASFREMCASRRRPSFGKPILLYDIRSKGADAYLDLTKELLRHEEKSPR